MIGLALWISMCGLGCDSPGPGTVQDSSVGEDSASTEGVFEGAYSADQATTRLYATEGQQHAGRVLTTGDLDGDGVEELVVTTVRDDEYEGGAWVLNGLPAGAGELPDHSVRLEGDASTRGAGRSASIGDVDGDGLGDLLLSAPYPGSDRLLLLPGPIDKDIDLADVTRVFLGADDDTTGHHVQLLDLNDDGLADIVSGAPGRFGTSDAGAVILLFAPFYEGETDLRAEADATLLGAENGDGSGRTLQAGGDIDGDGIADLLVGGPYADREGADRGVVHVVLGPFDGTVDLSDAQAELRGELPGDLAGVSLGLADVDGDGLADPVVGAQRQPEVMDGAVYVLTSTPQGTVDLGASEVVIRGESSGWALGWSIAARDIDGDGRAELLLGALSANSTGVAYLFDDPEFGSLTTADADAWILGESSGAGTGMGVALGDLDGDGFGDLVVGAPMEASAGENGGAVYVQLSGAE